MHNPIHLIKPLSSLGNIHSPFKIQFQHQQSTLHLAYYVYDCILPTELWGSKEQSQWLTYTPAIHIIYIQKLSAINIFHSVLVGEIITVGLQLQIQFCRYLSTSCTYGSNSPSGPYSVTGAATQATRRQSSDRSTCHQCCSAELSH